MSGLPAEPATFGLPDGTAVHACSVVTDPDPRVVWQDYPAPVAGGANLGFIHSSVHGEYSRSECLPASVAELESVSYDAWVMGHVHRRITESDAAFIGWVGMGHALLFDEQTRRVTEV